MFKWLLVGALAAVGCGADEDFTGCTKVVGPAANPDDTHQAVQTALSDANPGDVICLRHGTYSFFDELNLSNVSNIEIRGSNVDEGSVLDFAQQQRGANGLTITGADGLRMRRFTVKNTPGDAIRVSMTNGVTFDGLTVTWDRGPSTKNGAYGLYPVQSSKILIDHCSVSHASDAGIYVGQSSQIIVRSSEAFGNVAGIEIENSTDAEVMDNWSHDNVGGILVFNLPGLTVKNGRRAKVHNNRVEHNNQDNFADPAGIVHMVPPGVGLMILASDENEFHDNEVVGNESVGIAVVSYKVTMRDDYMQDTAYDLYPQKNYIHDNHFDGNGGNPQALAAAFLAGTTQTKVEDMVWDGYIDPALPADTQRNCFWNNLGATFRNLDGPGNYNHPSTDLSMYVCQYGPLPAVSF